MSIITQMMRDLDADESAVKDKKQNSLPLFAAANLLYDNHHQPTAKRARLIMVVALLLALGLLFVDRVLLAELYKPIVGHQYNANTPSQKTFKRTSIPVKEIEETTATEYSVITAGLGLAEDFPMDKPSNQPSSQKGSKPKNDKPQSQASVNTDVTAPEKKPTQVAIKKSRPLSAKALDIQRYEKASQILAQYGQSHAIDFLAKQLPTAFTHIKNMQYFKSVILNISLLINAHRFLEAEALLATYQAAHPSNVDFIKLAIRLSMAQRAYTDALALLNQHSIAISDDAEFTELRAAIQHAQGRYLDAQTSYQQLLQFDSRPSRWWMGLAIAFDAAANFKAAEQAYTQVLLASDVSVEHSAYASKRLTDVDVAR